MAALSLLQQRPKKVTRLTKNAKLFKTIINAIQDKKGEDILSLDLRKIPEAVSDFFIVCSATSTVQIKAISDHIDDQVKIHCNEAPFHQEGYKALKWVLLDYINVVVHIMQPDTRTFYKLEEMWSDAIAEKHEDIVPVSPTVTKKKQK